MNKRILTTVLWFLAGWYTTGMLAVFLGLEQGIAPFGGVAAAAFVAVDPLGLFWPRASHADASPNPDSTHRSRSDIPEVRAQP